MTRTTTAAIAALLDPDGDPDVTTDPLARLLLAASAAGMHAAIRLAMVDPHVAAVLARDWDAESVDGGQQATRSARRIAAAVREVVQREAIA